MGDTSFYSILALGLAACAGTDQGGSQPDPLQPSGSPIETGQISESLSNIPGCSSDPADSTIERHGSTSSPDSYPGGTCTAARRVDLENYSPGAGTCTSFGFGGNNGFTPLPQVSVYWDATAPTTMADCQDPSTGARVIAFVWDTGTAPPAFVGTVTKLGSWVAGSCVVPFIDINSSIAPLVPGHNYRFAITARQGPSANMTRRVGMRAL